MRPAHNIARVVALGLLVGAALFAAPAAQQSVRPLREIVTVGGRRAASGEVLVKFRRQLESFERTQLDQQTDSDENRTVGRAGVRRMHSRRYDTQTLLAFLRNHPDVEYAEPNYIVEVDALPNDPRFGQLWGLRNTGQRVFVNGTSGADIDAELAWDVSTGSAATVVAVIDTGIDYTHPDLAANVWSAPTSFEVTIGALTITCAAGTHGFNAITNTCNPMDDNGHGTHVSGTIGAAGNNALGVVGVNWTTSIMSAKSLGANGEGTVSDAINGIEFVIQAAAATHANVRVLSNSWSTGGFSQALLDEINKANGNNMLFVASAGNTTGAVSSTNNRDSDVLPHYPSSYEAPNIIAVASTDNTDTLAGNSNFGASSVHLAAPGVNIWSTYLITVAPGVDYQILSGTSMAAPHVSGAAALVLSRCPLNTAALKNNLLAAVDHIPALTGKVTTGGRLNVNTAIRACLPDFSVSADPATQTNSIGSSSSYTVTATPTNGFSGTVTFSVSGLPAGATASFTPPSVTTSGSSTMTITSSPTTPTGAGNLTITGTSGSQTRSAAVMLTVKAPTTTSLASNHNPRSYGSDITFAANVIGSTIPTGTVTFMDGTTTLGSAPLDASGQATWTTSSLSAGTHSITAVYGGGATFTGSTSLPVSQGVNPAALTVAANARTKTYGQTVTFAGTEFTTSGLLAGDTVTSVSLTSSGAAATAAASGSPYAIVPSAATGTGLSNYTISYVNGALTVTAKALTVTASARTKTYGQTVTFAGTEFTTSGLLAGDTVTSVTLTSSGAAATATAGGSPYAIVPSAATGTGLSNYTISFVNGALTVTAATVTVTATARTKTYGQTVTFAGTEFTTSGLFAGDTVTSVSLTSSGAAATAAASGSPYAIVPSAATGTGLSNYTISYVNGSLTVNAAAVTVTATARTKTYGQTLTFAGTEFTTSGLLAGDTVTSVTLTSSGAAATASTGGSPYAIVPSAATGTGLSNYAISYMNGSLTVSAAAVTVTATARTKTYGQTVTFAGTEFTTSGLLAGDTVTSVSLTSSGAAATASASGSPYAIVPSAATGTGLSNYTISYVNGSLAVSAATATVTATARTKTYGQTVTFAGTEFTTSGLFAGDTVTSVTLTSSGAAATAAAGGSPYAIVPSAATGSGLSNYTISYVNGSLTVSAAAATVTATARTKTYGQTVTFAGTEFTTSGLLAGDTVTSVTLTSSGAAATAAAGGSPYAIVPSAATGSGLSNYTISYVNGALTVNAAAATVTATARTKTYGQTLTFAGTEFTASGLLAGDTVTNVTLTSSGAAATAAAGGSPYAIVPSAATGSGLSNYTISYVTGSLTVTAAAATVTATARSKTYGQTVTFAGTEFTTSGLLAGDTVTSVTLTTSGAAATASTGGSPYTIVPNAATGTGLSNYTISYVNGALTVNAAAATVTAHDGTKVYGASDPPLTATATGFTAADALTIALSETRAAGEAVGSYVTTATATGAALTNYTVTYVTGSFTITKAAATVTAHDGTKVYGYSDPALTATATGFTAADALTIALSETRAAGEAVGSYVTTATATGAALSNYTVTYVTGSFTITKATATVTAHDGTKVYGASDPALTATATGFTAADALTIALSETRAAGEAVGSYATTATASGTALANYTVTYVAGSFSITKAAATVTAHDGTKVYGASDPPLTATATGFTAADALTIALSETRAAGEAVGSYVTTATATGAALTNYTVTYVTGSFSITKAAATVTAHDGTKVYGASDPPLTATATGFTAADALTIALSATRAAGEAVGSYATTATASGTALANYTVTYVAGSFSITKATATVTARGGTKVYGASDPPLTATATGFTAADALTIALSETRAAGEAVGSYATTATATGAALANYSVTYVTGSFSITKAAATVTAHDGTKAYGAADPTLTATATGFTTGDAAAIALSVTRAPGEAVGSYITTATATGAALSNYTVTYATGSFSITKAAATVTAHDGTKVYGASEPPLTATATGFTAADALTIALSETRAAGEVVGSYVTTATATGAALANYTVTYVAGSFSITTATATVTAGGGTKAYGTADPALTATATGFTTADAQIIALSETRAAGEAVGSYVTTATATGAALANYTVTYVTGSFTITTVAATVTAGSGTKSYGAADPPLSATATGFTAADALTIALSALRAPGEAPGIYATTAVATGAALSNYAVTYVAGTFTIVNHAPVASNDSYATDENVVLTVAAPGVLLNDSDVDSGDMLHAVLAVDGTLAIKLSWKAVPDAASYHVKRSTTSGGPYTTIAMQVPSPGYVDTGLAPGTVYYYVVSAVNAYGESPDSAEVNDLPAALGSAPTHGLLALDLDGSFTYTPVEGFHGTDAFLYQTKDAAGALSNIAIVALTTVHVNHEPVAADDHYRVDEDAVLTVPAPGLLANDSDVDVADTRVAVLARYPDHGALEFRGDGSFTYTPDPDFNGDDAFHYQAMDSTGMISATATVVLTVTPVDDAPVALALTATVPEDTVSPITLRATDVDGDALTYTVVSDPAHGTLTGTGQTLTYAPAAHYTGSDSFTFTAHDGTLASAPATVTLRILRVGTLVVDQVVSADAFGSTVTTPELSTSIPGETLIAFVTGAQPPTIERQTGSVSGGDLEWTLVTRANAQAGTAEIWKASASGVLSNIRVTADLGISDSAVSLTVVTFPWSGGVGASAAASAPTGEPRVSLTATTKGSLVYGAGNDWDGDVERVPADGQVLVYQELAPSADTFWVQMSLEPAAAAGTLVELSDTEPTTNQWNFAAVEILPLGAPPVAWQNPSAITYGTPLGDAQLNASVSVSGSAVPGKFTYTPAAGTVLAVGVNQTLTVTFTPTDLSHYATATATVQITVTPAPATITASGGSKPYGTADPALTAAATGFTAADAETIVLTATRAPGEAVGSYATTATATGAALSNYIVTYVAGTFTIVNRAPVATDAAVMTDEDTPTTIALGATDAEASSLTYTIVTPPAHGTLTGTAPALTYTPTANYNGADGFTFKANDGTADSNVATVTITVTAVNDAPVAVNGTLTTPENTTASGTLVATDVDGGGLTYVIVTNGTKGTATITNAATGAFTYTPSAASASGSDSFTFKARDASLDSNTASVTISMTPVTASIALSATTVAPGAAVTATIANGPGTASDWVTLSATGAPVTTYLQWQYLNGTHAAPAPGLSGATLTFTLPLTPGPYVLRFFRNNTFTVLATSVAITVGAPSITPSATTVAPGAAVTATIANGPATAGDWVTLSAIGAPAASYLQWQYLNGTHTTPAAGLSGATLTFTLPLTAGTYELRFFRNNTYTVLAASVAITVVVPSITPSATTVAPGATVTATIANGPGTAGDWVALYATGAPAASYLQWQYLNGTSTAPTQGLSEAALTVTLPLTPGTYELRFFRNNTYAVLATSVPITVSAAPSITPSATTVAAGAAVMVTIANGPATAGDWVTLSATGAPATNYLQWQYLNGTHTAPAAGLSGAALTFTLPLAPGTYVLRFFRNNTDTVLATSVAITVSAPSITPSATTVASGATVTATIANGPSTAGDWVALYATGAPAANYGQWQYLNGTHTAPAAGLSGTALTFTMPLTPGTYELRFLRNNTYAVLATSAAITIQ